MLPSEKTNSRKQKVLLNSKSCIKPHLINLSGSGSALKGCIVERNLECSSVELNSSYTPSPDHVIVIHDGNPSTLEWTAGGRKNEARFSQGDALINPTGFFTSPRWNSDVEILVLAINSDFMNKTAEGMGLVHKVELAPRYHFRDDLLKQLATSLIAEFEQNETADRIYAETLNHTLIAHVLKKYSVQGIEPLPQTLKLQPWKLNRIIDYINDNLDEDISLETIARVVDLSPTYFAALFKKSTGLAPHQYVMTRRLEKAKDLLHHTKKTIADIAIQTGFSDQSHLTRLLRRHTGLTPKEIRNRIHSFK
ncbi:MAG: AraC family transcriptional regulator [Desulfobacteraceae bacterium]|jgi:AraC family transcriptional regulator